eukprot:Rhum_TRINITY_DN16798_c0_g1::Rhum_TRINITY_DN16798_c0_g1_i1::g.164436::m.164436
MRTPGSDFTHPFPISPPIPPPFSSPCVVRFLHSVSRLANSTAFFVTGVRHSTANTRRMRLCSVQAGGWAGAGGRDSTLNYFCFLATPPWGSGLLLPGAAGSSSTGFGAAAGATATGATGAATRPRSASSLRWYSSMAFRRAMLILWFLFATATVDESSFCASISRRSPAMVSFSVARSTSNMRTHASFSAYSLSNFTCAKRTRRATSSSASRFTSPFDFSAASLFAFSRPRRDESSNLSTAIWFVSASTACTSLSWCFWISSSTLPIHFALSFSASSTFALSSSTLPGSSSRPVHELWRERILRCTCWLTFIRSRTSGTFFSFATLLEEDDLTFFVAIAGLVALSPLGI